MSQTYHANAKTNGHIRQELIGSLNLTRELATRYSISQTTVRKWRNRSSITDVSSKPNVIHYALNDLEKEVIRVVRTLTWCSIDELTETVSSSIGKSNRSNVYRTLQSFDINRIPDSKKAEAKKFKEYEPGYLHIDVTYLPKIEKIKHYLFVAIDRATRLLYFKVYANKTAANAVLFLEDCKNFFPFYVTHILTDNGLEFTDKYARGNNKPSDNHIFDKKCKKMNTKHRLTAPNTPKTNGMVERVNGTIKSATIKETTYNGLSEMKNDLNQFLVFYNTNRRHHSLRKELNVKTPLDAVRYWFNIKPEIFKINPDRLQDKLLLLGKTTV